VNRDLKDLAVAVLGAGESGEPAARIAREEGAVVTILDTGSPEKLREKSVGLATQGIRLVAGDAALSEAANGQYAFAILSPGIDPAVPLVRHLVERNIEIVGELEFAYERCQCPIVGITGTNGKTTTTQLVEKMLNACGVKTVAAGNIGPAFSARVRQSATLDLMTLEISSFQLETIRRFRPQISVWLGFAPDHLDRYKSMEEYYDAKVRIFENQLEEDWAVVNLRDHLPELRTHKITFSAYAIGGDFDLRDGVIYHHSHAVLSLADTKLRGSHNAENLMAALGVGVALGLSFDAMRTPLCEYRALPHRCELVRTLDGVAWVNDSKATNLDSVEKALAGETHPVVLIAGGKDKGYEFDSLTDLVAQKCRCVVLIGDMAERIAAQWGSRVRCLHAGRSLAEAIAIARREAQAGDQVLLSPGTSSFDMFKNYGDRGDQFRALVQALPTTL
jgi:UDP-N-acetylmuramoylalanine--D-glutamate ligase